MVLKMSTDRKRAALIIVLIFLCGAFTGTLATNLWTYWSTSVRADAPYSVEHTVERFTKKLDLTPDQAKQLNQILDETHTAYTHYEVQQETIREKGRNRIREMLTGEQRPKYEQMLARIDAKHKRTRK